MMVQHRALFFIVLVALSVVLGVNADAQGQDREGVRGHEDPFGERLLGALFDPRVQRELELTEDQQVELKSHLEELRSQRDELGRELRQFAQTATPEEVEARRAEMVEQFQASRQSVRTTVFEILLPHQKDRLKQVTAQVAMENFARNNEAGVLAPEMLKYLDIDEEQAARIRERATEIRQELAEEVRRLTNEARDELMQELTADQQKKYKQLIGERMER